MPRKVFPLFAKPLFKIIFSCISGIFKPSFYGSVSSLQADFPAGFRGLIDRLKDLGDHKCLLRSYKRLGVI